MLGVTATIVDVVLVLGVQQCERLGVDGLAYQPETVELRGLRTGAGIDARDAIVGRDAQGAEVGDPALQPRG